MAAAAHSNVSLMHAAMATVTFDTKDSRLPGFMAA
jgi:hypothetical protein